MNVLITAGGTTEKIDEVRGITNHATGALGCEIANIFLENGASVTYLASKNAKYPNHPNCQRILITSTMDLYNAFQTLLTEKSFDAVIHSMAVSDYQPTKTVSEAQLLKQLTTTAKKMVENHELNEIDWENAFKQTLAEISEEKATKISSKHEALWLKLAKTPKIIESIKLMQPDTLLVGFKLLVKVTPKELQQVALNLLEKNSCDFVLANDLSEVHSHQHHAYLLKADGSFQEAFTKKEIATLIYDNVTRQRK